MTVLINKPGFNLREALTSLKRKIGLKGAEIMRAETASDVYGVIGQNRNVVINGDMRIAQRGTSTALGSGQSGVFNIDRLGYQNGGYNGAITYAQDPDAPPGFGYCAKMTVTTAHSGALSATSYAGFYYVAEGFDCLRFGWGTTGGKSAALSFWVKSSVPGDYLNVGIRVQTSGGTQSCFTNISINAANTWEYKTVIIPPCPYAITERSNSGGIQIHINPLAGVADAGTTTNLVWQSINALGTNARANKATFVGTTGATLQVTGIQLETGSVATPFEHRPFHTELAMCQRYYEVSYPYGQYPGSSQGSTAFGGTFIWKTASDGWYSSMHSGSTQFKVQKRTSPTTRYWDHAGNLSNCGSLYGSANQGVIAGSPLGGVCSNGFFPDVRTTANAIVFVYWEANAEL